MIRVAYASPAPHGGGALNYLVDLVEAHDRTRFEPTVFLDDRLAAADDAVARLARTGAAVVRGPLASAYSLWTKRGRWESELRRRGPFDVASLHQHVPGFGAGFLEGARRAGVPLLVRTEQLPRFPPFERRPWRPARIALRLSRAWLAATTHRRVAVAEAGKRVLVARGEPAETIDVIPPAFREDAFADLPPRDEARRRAGLPERGVLVGFLASLSEQKRPDHFLDAAERVLRTRDDAAFVVGGDGPWADLVRARVASLGPRVVAIGARRDVPTVLAALDVFVLPSLWEGLPLTVLEAMRAGAAVVATSVDGTPEVVRDGETGRLVPPGDPGALAAAIEDLVARPGERRRLADAARAFVVGRFDAAALARRTEALYDAALAARRSASR